MLCLNTQGSYDIMVQNCIFVIFTHSVHSQYNTIITGYRPPSVGCLLVSSPDPTLNLPGLPSQFSHTLKTGAGGELGTIPSYVPCASVYLVSHVTKSPRPPSLFSHTSKTGVLGINPSTLKSHQTNFTKILQHP